MASVGGLRPTNSDQPEVRQKKGRLTINRNSSNRVSLRPSAAPVNTYVRPGATPDVSSNLEKLSSALSQLNPTIGRLAAQYQQGKEEDQMAKLRFYTEQFMSDKEKGAVTAAQVKEQFPELVPTVAARIAQATGEIEAKRWVQGQIQEILQNDDLRLNTQNRQAYLEQIREEARGIIGENEFYGTGFLTQLDRSLGEFETSWMRETASHHEQIQTESFSNQVAQVLQSGGDLMELDAQWKDSSSLSNLERNAIVVETAIAQAVANQNPALLEKVPDRFLNAESKGKIAQAQQQIEQSMYSRFVRSRELAEWERTQRIRDGKVHILSRLAGGEEVPPAEFYHTPELFEYAMRLNSQPTISSTVSVRNAENLKSRILQAGTTGSFMDDPEFQMFFGDEDSVSEEGLRDFILSRSDLNPAEQQALIEEVPVLMDGVNFIRNPEFNTHYTNTIGNDVQVFARSVQGSVLQQMGVNVQGDVQNAYRERLRQEVMAYIETKGEIPKGQDKLDILQRADEAASRRLQFIQQNYRELLSDQAAQMRGSSQPSGGGQMNRNRKRNNEEDNEQVVDWGELD
jgi:hypothetical protein